MGGTVTLAFTLTPAAQFVWIAIGAGLVMFALWLIQLKTRDATPVDVGWSLSIGAAAIFVALTSSGDLWTRTLLATLAAIWALRLGGHLLVDRVLQHKPEDGRYAALRSKFAPGEQPIFAIVYFIQGTLVVALALPFVLGVRDTHPGLNGFDIAGLALWLVGLITEALADAQLRHFKAQPGNRGQVCDRGLWRYSRHPNFFGEWLMWCAYALIASSAPGGLWAWLAPALMLLLITRVSGIPPTEAQSIRSRGDAYRAYQRRTSAFFPLPPRVQA
jgi:steroid 5-alpha reductase family enzyme